MTKSADRMGGRSQDGFPIIGTLWPRRRDQTRV